MKSVIYVTFLQSYITTKGCQLATFNPNEQEGQGHRLWETMPILGR